MRTPIRGLAWASNPSKRSASRGRAGGGAGQNQPKTPVVYCFVTMESGFKTRYLLSPFPFDPPKGSPYTCASILKFQSGRLTELGRLAR